MSARKMTDTKVPEDDNIDSGFLSGPLSEDLLSSTDLSEHSDSYKVVSDCVRERDQDEQIDSGLDLCVSEFLSERLDYTPTAAEQTATEQQSVPAITVNDDKNDVPPLGVLFLQDDDGDTQLHIAAVHGCQKSVSTLVKLCPNKLWLNIPNDYGHTALHLAVMSGHPVVTRMLLLAGATLDVRDHCGETPLHIAITYNQKDCLQSLLNPVEGRRISQSVLNEKNYEGQTCVHLAAKKGLQECLQILVFHGADINAKENLAGRTALHFAASAGNLPLTKYLLERCPGVDRFARDFAGHSPRRVAARTPAARLFANMAAGSDTDSDSESDSDDEMCQCMKDRLFDSLRQGFSAINVA